jgi:NitT/TauT family transport system substrate-binding protein
VHSIADRKGKIVAVWRGARSQQPVLRALEHAGLPRDSVPDAVDATTAVANSSFRRSANASPSWIARS